jgi:hypothetical protein
MNSSLGNKVYQGVLRLGRFLRIVDEKFEQISIVNIACLVIIVKVAMVPEPSVADLGALLIGLMAHYGKRRINVGKEDSDSSTKKDLKEAQDKIKELGDRIGSIAAAMGFTNLKK